MLLRSRYGTLIRNTIALIAVVTVFTRVIVTESILTATGPTDLMNRPVYSTGTWVSTMRVS